MANRRRVANQSMPSRFDIACVCISSIPLRIMGELISGLWRDGGWGEGGQRCLLFGNFVFCLAIDRGH